MARKPVIVPKVSNTEDLPIADVSAPEPVLPRKPKEEKPEKPKPKDKPDKHVRAPVEVPAMVEFLPTGEVETWRVDKCDLLATEFGLAEPPVDLAVLERRVAEFVFFCQSHPRLWLLVRRLYGIASVIPAEDAHPSDLRIWTRAELEASWNSLTRKALQFTSRPQTPMEISSD